MTYELSQFWEYFLLAVAMCSCVLSLWAISLCKAAAMSDIDMDKYIQQKRGRNIGLWKIAWQSKKGETIMIKEGQYLNDMLEIVKKVVTSEEYSHEKHYLTVTFD